MNILPSTIVAAALVAVTIPAQQLASVSDGFDRAVAPGRVAWHESHAAALAAAKTSGKPVLHFQLLGRLDREFC